MIDGVAFDLDGTLWDATTPIWYTWGTSLHKGPDDIPIELVRSLMGKSSKEIAKALGIPKEQFTAIQQKELHTIRNVVTPTIYEGVEATINTLKQMGLQIYIVSSCQQGYIDEFVRLSGLPKYLFEGLFYDGYPCKNKALNLQYIKDNLKGTIVYVGDTDRDREAALQSHSIYIRATYGFGEGVGCGDRCIDDIRQLPPLLRMGGFLDV